jgi:hypothetical protein
MTIEAAAGTMTKASVKDGHITSLRAIPDD